jgi:hypothetical protein|tara:strand:+ start:2051 stop:2257 length:207 start_codon:yes stop_codon:yes gene_type:complete
MSINKRYIGYNNVRSFVDDNNIEGLEKSINMVDSIITTDNVSTETVNIILDEDLNQEKKHEMIRNLFI